MKNLNIGKFTSILPEWGRHLLKHVIITVRFYGKSRVCTVCGKSSRRFRRFGTVPRENAQCAYCGSLERHRFLWLFLTNKTDLFDGNQKKVLHVAPEPCLENRLRERIGVGYITADLFNSRAMVKMDITNIKYPDQSFDVVYCSHVLEHVQDDKQAIREFHRVLKKNGWAILLVPPISSGKTYEDPSIIAPEARLIAFGQKDHVRRYGKDYVDRLREAGFKIEVIEVNDIAAENEAILMGLTLSCGEIYYCTK